MATNKDRVAQLSERKRALLDALLAKQGVDLEHSMVLPRQAEGPAPLSYGQERLWWLHRLDPASTAYNLHQALRLVGRLDTGALMRALGELFRRHEVLRSVVTSSLGGGAGGVDDVTGPELAQEVRPVPRPPCARVDLTALPADRHGAELHRLAQAEADRPFDLERDLPLRCLLVDSGGEHALLFTLHHIATDGWSMSLLVGEVSELYRAFAAGRRSPLRPLPVQYGDFAAWQRRTLDAEAVERQLAYWRERLAGAPDLLELPTDRPRPARPSFRGAARELTLPGEVADGVRGLARGTEATLFMTLLAVLQIVLGRLSGQADVVVGTAVANRRRPELEGLIGFFVNTLALRGDLSEDLPFRDFLARVVASTLEAYDHQDVPFEKVVEAVRPDRRSKESPLFQVLLTVQNAPLGTARALGDPDGGALELVPLPVEGASAKVDLTWTLSEHGGALSGTLRYRADLFDDTTAERWVRSFRTLLAAAVADPDRRIAELPALPREQRHQVLFAWSHGPGHTPGHTLGQAPGGRGGDRLASGTAPVTVVRLFEERTRRAPAATAVACGDELLSYADLDRRSRSLAGRLLDAGVEPGSVVGLATGRSTAMVVGVVGILRAGGAYLYFEPDAPGERRRSLLEDAGVRVVVATSDQAGAFEGAGRSVVPVAAEKSSGVEQTGIDRPLPEIDPRAAAYLVYTSGSTGRPKGVVVEHRQLTVHLRGFEERLDPPSRAAYGLVQPLSVDGSKDCLFLPLVTGGSVHVLTEAETLDAAALMARFERHPVDVLKLAPSHLAALLATGGDPARLLPTRLVIGGEASDTAWAVDLARRAPHCLILNNYGPTETTVGVVMHPVRPVELAPGARALPRVLPLGRPLADTRAQVLDVALRPVPVGAPGELCVGGRTVTRGYLGQPARTAERFVPDPLGGTPGERLYRTGDLVRHRRDGLLEFLGRVDRQLKVRGFRIEPGEIEAALTAHPSVGRAAVTGRRESGETRLTAYLVPAADHRPEPRELVDFLRGRLPEAMRPSAWVVLDELPRTAQGKVDLRALPEPEDRGDGSAAAGSSMPRSELEALLAEIWGELLGVEQVGVDDDFFDLGGHSLLATRLLFALQRALPVPMALEDVFLHPTVGELARAVDARLAESSPGAAIGTAPPAIEPLPRDAHGVPLDRPPLSFAQQRLWFLARLEPSSTAYHSPVAVRLEGPLDPAALAAALQAVVDRHEALRTVFPTADGLPWQQVLPELALPLPTIDLSRLEETRRDDAVRRLAVSEARQPFDPTTGPLLRARLVRLGPAEHVVVLARHHLVSDEWSTEVLFREVAALYGAGLRGELAALDFQTLLPPLPIQYADFSAWQRAWLTGDMLEAEIGYWREALDGIEPVELPADRPRPTVATSRGDRRRRLLPAEIATPVRRLARREGATPFMVLAASFQALLGRLTGRTDFALGTPVANRRRPELEGLIGFFDNTLVLRGDLSGRPSFRELLARTRETALRAFAHQDLPFERLVEELQPRRDLARHPLFQVMLVMQTAPDVQPAGDLSLTWLALETRTAKLDLTLFGGLDGDRIRLTAEHSTDLFDGTTIERWLDHLAALLAAVGEDPDRRPEDLPLLPAAMRHQVLREWSTAAGEADAAEPVHRRVARVAAERPDAVAAEWRGEELGYGELAARADRLAQRLARAGVGPDVPVGLLLERSLDLLVAVQGVLEAGGTVLALDPALPAARLEQILDDARPAVVLSAAGLEDRLPATGVETLRIDRDSDPEEQKRAPGASTTDRETLVYLIYTSGSTGRPKGVALPHGVLADLIAWQEHELPGPARTLHFAPLSFDVSFQEIFSTWSAGGTLIVAGDEERRDPRALWRLLAERRVERLFLPFVALQELAEAAPTDLPATLRDVVTAGEQLRITPAIAALFDRLPGTRLHNHYGPSETHVVTARVLDGPTADWPRLPPIGRPVARGRVHVVDAALRPALPGAAGELCLGGAFPARGYLRRPGLTAERFVPDPFGGAGARLYRTGDGARFAAGGELEFLGRLDHQVKIRGYRVEPGEVEAVLEQHPRVGRAVVTVRAGATGPELAAFVVPAGAEPGPHAGPDSEARPDPADRPVDLQAVRSFLRDRLPAYMVPRSLVALEALPLTASGKVDRKALPHQAGEALDAGGAEPAAGRAAPRTPVEALLAEIWADLLGVASVGIHDDFFDLGGHSLLATRVCSRLRHALDADVPVRQVFETPTVAGLATAVDTRLRGRGRPAPPPIRRRDGGSSWPLSYAQERLWFLQRLQPRSSAYNLPFPLRVTGALDLPALAASLAELVRRHESLRTRLMLVDGAPRQVVDPPPATTLPLVDLAGLPERRREQEARRLARSEARRPFDLATGALVRHAVARLGRRDHALFLTLHHVAGDGWSTGVLSRELSVLYRAFSAGRPSPLADLPVQYPDFAVWQRTWLEGGELDRQVAFWRDHLDGAPAALDLPTDRPRPPVQSFAGATRALELSPEVETGVRRLARQRGATPSMVLLAAFAELLRRHGAGDDLVLGLPVANRTDDALEGLIGFFVNVLPVRLRLDRPEGDGTFGGIVASVREVELAAFAHQDVPFELLVERLGIERDASRPPLVQAAFNLLNTPTSEVDAGGLELRPMRVGAVVARVELLLTFQEPAASHSGTGGSAGLRGTWEYATALFDATTVERLSRAFARLVEVAVAAPESRLADLPVIPPASWHQVVREWGTAPGSMAGAIAAPATRQPVLELFLGQARRAPDAPAVVAAGAILTYGELARRSAAVARSLRARGIGPEDRVAVALGRSPVLVAVMLGIARAGAVYVPVDPSLPAARRRLLIEDSAAALVVSTAGADQANGARGEVAVDELVSEGWAAKDSGLDGSAVPDSEQLAYVIYTSGSTGRPKGVAIPCRALEGIVDWYHAAYDPGPADRVSHLSGVGFDASVIELWPALCAGASVHLVPSETVASPPELVAWVAAHRITLLLMPTPLAEPVFATALDPGPSLRAAIVGGDRLRRRPPAMDSWRVLNHLGPTETTVVATWGPVPSTGEGLPTVGRPRRGVSAVVCDPSLRPVPAGVEGELCFGGSGLARGYLGLPARTAQTFVPDPWSSRPGERLYRSGDLARHRGDGELEFIGRRDGQVKIRGHRVELGEVEAALERHPAVHEAVAVARSGPGGVARLVAYVALQATAPAAARTETASRAESDLRAHLREHLPEAMVPSVWVFLDVLPRTSTGKVDRRALPDPRPAAGRAASPESAAQARADAGASKRAPAVEARTQAERRVAEIWSEVLGVAEPGLHDNFFDVGGHSLLLIQLQERLTEAMGRPVPAVELLRRSTIAEQATLFESPGAGADPAVAAEPGPAAGPAARTGRRDPAGDRIAIVGMALRVPGAATPEAFWNNLRDGVESIRHYDDEELLAAGVDRDLLADPRFVKAGARIDGADLFDAALFGIPPREAELMDPQHRVFLECAWEALEHAGHAPSLDGAGIGVFAGCGLPHYLLDLANRGVALGRFGLLPLVLSNRGDFLPNRVSYKLDLGGPSVNVQTACSTALVAVHLAGRSLREGECDLALAGAVTLGPPRLTGYLHEEGGINSPDGHCRTFDHRAAGTVGAEGAAVVVLKRLADARADGDTVHAVIRGSAINNDGSRKVGLTAPSVEGQAVALAEALAASGVDPGDVGFIETHGTGTRLGDPVELDALARVYGRRGHAEGGDDGDRPCVLGALKTNIGHLDTAAGGAGLIKAVLALTHEEIPPTLHFERPNPEIAPGARPELAGRSHQGSRFVINREPLDWRRGDRPRHAAVSSFGMGGTNAHVVLEEAPLPEPPAPSDSSRPAQLLVLSAATDEALRDSAGRLAARLAAAPELPLADAAFTLQVGRQPLGRRRAWVCRDSIEAIAALEGFAAGEGAVTAARERRAVFLFPGQGAQHPAMGAALYRDEAQARRWIDRCADSLEPSLGLDLRRLLGIGLADGEEAPPLDRTALAQPALFTLEYALARLWMSWGVEPEALLGHSLGEYVAACLAGVMDLDDALALVAERGRLMDALPPGAMLAVPLAPDAVEQRLTGRPGLALAAVNGPERCVVSGEPDAIAAFEDALAADDVPSRRLATSHAFHSPMMDGVLEPFRAAVSRVELRPPRIPIVSNVTGTWLRDDQAVDPDYWVRHLRQPVLFAPGLAELVAEPRRAFLEVGPGRTLCRLARRQASSGQPVVPSMEGTPTGTARTAGPDAPPAPLLTALGRLWQAGCPVSWHGVSAGERRRRVPLPTYPFARHRFRIAAEPGAARPAAVRSGARQPPSRWLYAPQWQSKGLPPAAGEDRRAAGRSQEAEPPRTPWLVFDGGGLGPELVAKLRSRGDEVIVARPGDGFERLSADEVALDPGSPEDFRRLLADLAAEDRSPGWIAYLWTLDDAADLADTARDAGSAAGLDALLERSFYAPLFLAQALAGERGPGGVEIALVTVGTQQVGGDDRMVPENATLTGLARVIPQEIEGVGCRLVDLVPPAPSSGSHSSSDWTGLADRVVAELEAGGEDPIVAYRGRRRWVPVVEPCRDDPDASGPSPFATSPDRVRTVLVTGGLGGLGWSFARRLGAEAGWNLVLTGRAELPAPERRRDWIEEHGEDDPTSRKIRRLEALEEQGAEVLALAADVCDPEAMAEVLRRAEERFGRIDGVIHTAGLPGGGLIPLKTREAAAAVLAPKIHGTRVLGRLLADRSLEFFVLCSSLAALAPPAGQVDYCAANAFLDAFAQSQPGHRTGPGHWRRLVSIGWDAWREVGMAVEAVSSPAAGSGDGEPRRRQIVNGLSPDEGAQALERALRLDEPHVAVSTRELTALLERRQRPRPEATAAGHEPASPAGERHERPALETPYAAPADDVEIRIAEVWQDCLGVRTVGRDDDFFDLGGDSLFATRIVSRLRRELGCDLVLRDFLERPTVAGQAALVAELRRDGTSTDAVLGEILDEIG